MPPRTKKTTSAPATRTTPRKRQPVKSQYFEASDSGKEDGNASESAAPTTDDEDGVSSAYSISAAESSEEEPTASEESDDEEDYGSGKKRKRPLSKAGASSAAKRSKPENQAEDDEDDVEDTPTKNPKTGFVRNVKARGDGGVPYQNDRIHPNTLRFLGELKSNNERPWFKQHEPVYKQAKDDFESFTGEVGKRLQAADFTIPDLPLKDLVFRIYRDIRFSNDHTPYKTNLGVAWSRTGRKGPFACYYMHVAANNQSFLGGGLWCPPAQQLAELRKMVDKKSKRLKQVLMSEDLKREFFSTVSNVTPKSSKKFAKKGKAKEEDAMSEEAIVEKFISGSSEGALKTAPKGFPKDHPDIGLLRLRNYVIGKKFKDEEVTASDFLDKMSSSFAAMVPFVDFLNQIVMPDANAPGADSDSSGEESGEDSGSDS